MKTFFTADTHFAHVNIIKYSKRPFKDTAEMNEAIISNWNGVVGKNDLVYHLGDFCFGRNDEEFDLYFKRLNGLIILIKGNHDRLAWRNRHKFYASYDTYHEIKTDGLSITLCHYAMKIWNKSHHGAFHLYGHSHGSLADEPHSLSMDVGVDCHNFTPVSFDQVQQAMRKKIILPVDHHGKPRD